MNELNFTTLQGRAYALWNSVPTISLPKAVTTKQLVITLIATTVITALVSYRETVIAAVLNSRITGWIVSPLLLLASGRANADTLLRTSETESHTASPNPSATEADEAPPPPELTHSQQLLMLQKGNIEQALSTPHEGAAPTDNPGLVQIPSKMDGNCMFHSLASYLIHRGLTDPHYLKLPSSSNSIDTLIQTGAIPTHEAIRSHIANCLHNQVVIDPRLEEEAGRTIRELNLSAQERYAQEREGLEVAGQFAEAAEDKTRAAELLKKLEAPEKITPDNFAAYIEKLREPGFFGGGAELYLLAKFYGITIRIYVENRPDSAAAAEARPYELIYDISPNTDSIAIPEEEGASGGGPAQAPKPICHLLFSPGGPHYDFLMPLETQQSQD